MNNELIKAFLKTMNEVDEEMRKEFGEKQAIAIELEKKHKEAMKVLQDLVNQASVLTKFRKKFEDKFLGEDSQETVIPHSIN